MSFSTSSSSDRASQSTQNETLSENVLVKGKDYEKELIESISFMLLKQNCENKGLKDYKKILKAQSKMIFTSKQLPTISLSDYLNRIINYTKVEHSTLIAAMIYLKRYCTQTKTMLNEYNTHRLLVTSIIVSIKFNEDEKFNNLFYSVIAGTDLRQMNQLEEDFLDGLNFNMFIDERSYDLFERSLF